MTLPYLFQWGWEDNSAGGFDSTTNGNSKITIKHYSQLARFPYQNCYKGSYCADFDLSLGTSTAYYEEATGMAVAANTAAACRFYFWLSPDLVMAASDTFDMFIWQSAGPASEFSVNILNNAGVITVRAGDTVGATFRSSPISLGQWHCIELVINTGTGVNATCTAHLDNVQMGAQITGITCAALTQGRLGAMNQDAGTTLGHLMFDEVCFDDTRIGPLSNQFSRTRVLTQSGHAILGQASILEADLVLSSANDEVATLWDSDAADTTDLSRRIFVYGQTNRIYVTQGLYVTLSGTNPVFAVKVAEAQDMSSNQIQQLGLRRRGLYG